MNKFKLFMEKNKKSIIKSVFIILVLGLVVFTGVNELKSIDLVETRAIMGGLSLGSLVLFSLVAVLALSAISLYDFIIVDYLELDINKFILFNTSFLANTINNLSGLGGLTGATIRTILFRNSKNRDDDLINYNFLLLPASGIGLSIMTVLALLRPSYIIQLLGRSWWLGLAILAFILFLPLYFNIEKIFNSLNKKYQLDIGEERFEVRLKLMGASLLEWMAAFGLFYLISLSFNWKGGIYPLFISFTLASIGGILSLLPGGLGSFDLIVLIQLQDLGLGSENILALLLVYRMFYYLIPLVLSVVLTLLVQTRTKEKLIEFPKLRLFINKTAPITNILLAILILISALLILLDGLFPSFVSEVGVSIGYLPGVFLRLSYNLQIAIGILLLGAAKQIRYKVKRSYNITLALLLFGLVILFAKDFSYVEALYILLVVLLLYLSKDSFYRESIPRDPIRTGFTFLVFFLGIVFYTRSSRLVFESLFKDHNIKGLFPGDLKGLIISYLLPLLAFLAFEKTKKTIEDDPSFEDFNEGRLLNFLETYDGSLTTHLAFLGDKNIFYSRDKDFMVQYALKDKMAIVLGDPIGSGDSLQKGLDEFREFIDRYGYKSAFYEASEELLSFYHDNGYHLFKLGETGILSLEDFSMEGSKSRDFRNIVKRFDKDGYVFEVRKKGDLDHDLYREIKDLSDQWLGDRKEMRFSLGLFDRDYLEKADLATIKDKETGELIAFSSMMPAYDGRSISIDLMRIKNQPPNNTMVFLILSLILHYQEEGLKVFNLGMAPLSNVGTAKKSHKGEKMAHAVFEYGNFFYSFHGLRNFKNKFKPSWEGRYLVYEDLSKLPYVLMEVTALIHSEIE